MQVDGADKTVLISAKTEEGMEIFREALEDIVPGKKQKAVFLIPYSEGALLPLLHQDQMVLSEEYTENGTRIEALVDEICYAKLRNYVLRD